MKRWLILAVVQRQVLEFWLGTGAQPWGCVKVICPGWVVG